MCSYVSRVVPIGTKGTGPRFVTRPACLRSYSGTTPTHNHWLHMYIYYMVSVQITLVNSFRALQTTSGWAVSNAVMWNAVGCTLATRVDSLRVGAAAKNG